MGRFWEALQKAEQNPPAKVERATPVVAAPIPAPLAYDLAVGSLPDPGSVVAAAGVATESPASVPAGGDVDPPLHGVRTVAVADFHLQRLARVSFHTAPNSMAADRFRLLRMRLRHLAAKGLKRILITSPLPRDGKTTVSTNLAAALAEQGKQRVLLVDADLHKKSLGEHLGLRIEAGLVECLHGSISPLSAIVHVEPLGFHLLPAGGSCAGNPGDMLRPQETARVLQQLSLHFDWILIDSPPVLALSDAISLSQACDGVLLIARAGCTPKSSIEDTLNLIGGRNVVGLVLNAQESVGAAYSRYQTYYQADED